MNVKELIEHLSQFQQDASVLCAYRACSEYMILEPEEITFHQGGMPDTYYKDGRFERRWVMRNGQVMEYDPKTWDPNEVPVFLDMVAFPGN